MSNTECHITLRTHHAYIHVNDRNEIFCFKYNDNQCDWDQFEDYDTLSDWMFKPLDQFHYRVELE
jgi:hypothetical protein